MTSSKNHFSAPPNILQLEPYRPGKPEEELMRELGLKQVIKMASNENCLGPSPLAIKAMHDSVERVHRYPDGSGYYVKHALSEKLNVPFENIILGNGSTDLVEMLARTYLQPGENAVTADQTFLMYRMAVLAVNASCSCVALKNFTYDLDEILHAINEQTRIVFIANPNNPTGTMVTRNQLETFLGNVPAGVIIAVDEAYSEYVDSSDYPNAIEYLPKYQNLIVLRTFSKVYGLAGIRMGYGLASAEIIDHLNRVRSPFNTNTAAQAAALAALQDHDHVERSRKLNREQREFLIKELRKMSLDVVPSVANFILIPVENSLKIYERLLAQGIIVRPMESFQYHNGLRVTVGTPGENEAFLRALKASL